MQPSLTAFEHALIARLADRASLASAIYSAWSTLPKECAQSSRSLVSAAQLGVTEETAAADILKRSAELGLLEETTHGFLPRKEMHGRLARLAFALAAIDYYRSSVHRDETTAQVVLTKPPQPSALEQKLMALGWRATNIEPTEHAFHGMVQAARRQVVVMTPFMDSHGASWLQELFAQAPPQTEKVLILRSLECPTRKDYPCGFDSIRDSLAQQRVRVFNYSIGRDGGGRETFHAKAVLCDRSSAYLGSSNVTAASLEHSMEMGVILSGKAAASVADVIDAVLAAATEWR